MPAGRSAYVLDHPLGGLFWTGVFWFHASFLRHYDETTTLLKSQHQFGDIGADGEHKGRSSRKIQQEFEHIRKRYWGQRFWARGYFSTTSGNITDEVILNYLDKHTRPNKAGFSPKP